MSCDFHREMNNKKTKDSSKDQCKLFTINIVCLRQDGGEEKNVIITHVLYWNFSQSTYNIFPLSHLITHEGYAFLLRICYIMATRIGCILYQIHKGFDSNIFYYIACSLNINRTYLTGFIFLLTKIVRLSWNFHLAEIYGVLLHGRSKTQHFICMFI